MNTSKSLKAILSQHRMWTLHDDQHLHCHDKHLNEDEAIAAIVEAVEGIYGDSDCWLWAGAKDNDGYGRFQGEVASRYFYKLWVGEIPEGLVVMHKCDTPPCFNPAHLTLGTVAANNADMVAKKRHLYPNRGKYWQEKTHCKHGHEYTAENTLTRKDGRRYCRECDLTRKRKREFAGLNLIKPVPRGAEQTKGTIMDEFKHLDIEKVSARHIEEWLKIARLQGQWTATKSLQHQAELLGTEGPILEQFKVAIKRIEEQLPTPAASVVATTEGTDLVATDKEARND